MQSDELNQNHTIVQSEQFSDLELLTKLFTAFNLLGEVLSHDSPFTSELLPTCTEKFLQQANYKLNQLQYRIQYQSEQSFVGEESAQDIINRHNKTINEGVLKS